ncbi:hypothetical protein NDU88_004844 [Pleurodeles waltl]|uniref:Reverse transcriptase domain-containing protein n=1 Tax=Pleurodeles waltl TaxID=8319 RepID=A0AAV7UJ96_PLEWA|nr:hypothetical protein NDU88_004844 [Pleurodeles waltl]
MAFFDDNRDTLAAELFSKKPLAPRTTDPTPSTQGLRQKFIKLERLRKQELARWWDITTLKRYLEIKQVPRGLRVIIFPSFEDLDPDLLGEWEHLISSTSFSMINILIKHSDRKRTKLLLDITSLEEEIKNLNLPEATDKNYTIMREILTGYQLYIKDKKMRKLVRDDNDYKNGRIYTFARKFDQGLGFCPSSKPDYTNIHIDLFKFIRNLKLKKFFHNKPDTNKNAHTAPPTCNQTIGDLQDIHTVLSLDNTSSPSPSFDELLVQLNVIPNLDVNSGLKPNSMFVPTLPPDNHIDVFYQAVSTELYNLEDKRSTRTHRPSNNLNSEELRALHKLSVCPDIVIREADKGGNVVVMNRSDYVAEIDRQLNDTQAYSLLPSNPLSNITSMIKKKLTFWRNHCLLTDLEYRFLYIEAPRAPCIYILPKVHKPGGFPPGRPIISGIGSPTEHISEYIDSFLQPLVHNLPSYIQDTRDLLCQLEDIDWSEDFMFVCLDVSSLYTSIPLERGLEMLQRTLNTRDATLFDHTRMLLDLTRLVLENNVFLHDGRWYRQCQGVAMGAKFSPSYANLYMGQFEKKHLWSNCPPDLTEHILYWGRYIDDILAIWTGNVSDLNILIKHLNTNDFNLVFTHKMDTTKIEFLDLLLYITDNKIMSRLYRKPTACNSVLHAHSAHPLSQIRAIPYGEMGEPHSSNTYHLNYIICVSFDRKEYPPFRLLNMAFFDDNRDTLAAELFSKKPLAPRTTDPTPSTQGLRQKFIKLERLRKQELARWWDITTLKRYLEIKQVPRGLRVIIFPSFEDLDPDLLGEWEHLISSTSFSMINILIKHSDRKRTKLLLDITSLEEEIKNLNLPEATDKNYTIMREILTGYQLYIKDKKMRKLVRDDNDYKNGRIYTFARKFDQVNKESNTRPTNIYTPAEAITGSLSDISNISSDCSDPPREGSSTNMTLHNTTQQSNSFLEELGRYRKGLRQNYNRSGTNIDPPAGGAGNTATNTRGGMTTRSTTKTQRP